MMSILVTSVIHPLWPASADSPAPHAGLPTWLWIACGLAAALVVGGAISWLAWRDRRRNAPVERAFRAMSRRLRLGRARAELVRTIAEDRDLPPVALLISQHAFDHAAATSTRSLDPQVVSAARHYIFGDH